MSHTNFVLASLSDSLAVCISGAAGLPVADAMSGLFALAQVLVHAAEVTLWAVGQLGTWLPFAHSMDTGQVGLTLLVLCAAFLARVFLAFARRLGSNTRDQIRATSSASCLQDQNQSTGVCSIHKFTRY